MPRGPRQISDIDAQELLLTSRAFKSVDDKRVMAGLRKTLRNAASPIADKARNLIAPYSSAVARTITVQTAFTTKKTGVFIVAARKKMPAGHEPLPGLFERGSHGNPRGFRHPLFGDKDHWFEQPVHPFLRPALAGSEDRIVEQVRADVAALLRASGLTVD